MAVPFATNLSAVETKLTFSKRNFSQCQFATNFWRQVPENTQNLKEQCTKHIAETFFLCNEVRKIKPSCTPEKWTLGRIKSHSFNNVLSRFSGIRKSNKNLILTITVHHFMQNLHSLPMCLDTTKCFCGLLVFLLLCKLVFHWTSFPTPG